MCSQTYMTLYVCDRKLSYDFRGIDASNGKTMGLIPKERTDQICTFNAMQVAFIFIHKLHDFLWCIFYFSLLPPLLLLLLHPSRRGEHLQSHFLLAVDVYLPTEDTHKQKQKKMYTGPFLNTLVHKRRRIAH